MMMVWSFFALMEYMFQGFVSAPQSSLHDLIYGSLQVKQINLNLTYFYEGLKNMTGDLPIFYTSQIWWVKCSWVIICHRAKSLWEALYRNIKNDYGHVCLLP